MTNTASRTHPLVVIAATAVILTCLLAIGMLTGVVPSPLLRERPAEATLNTGGAPAPEPAATGASNAYVPTVPSTAPRRSVAERASSSRVERAPPDSSTEGKAVGGSPGTSPSRTVAGTEPARAAVQCTNCGTVTSVRAIRQQGEAGIVGPAAGGLIGGVIGHQIGSGSGNTIATVVGAAGGAAAGTEIERRYKSTTRYVVAVRTNDGSARSFDYASAPGFEAGDRVRVVDGRLVHD